MTGPWIVAFALLAGFVVLLGVTVAGLLRRSATVLEDVTNRLGQWQPADMGGLPAGSEVPAFELWDSEGRRHSVRDVLPAPSIMLLLEPGCEPCFALAGELARSGWHSRVPLVTVWGAEHGTKLPPLPPPVSVFYQGDLAASLGVEMVATPSGFAIGTDGRVVAKNIPNESEHLEWLVSQLDGGGDVDRAEIGTSNGLGSGVSA